MARRKPRSDKGTTRTQYNGRTTRTALSANGGARTRRSGSKDKNVRSTSKRSTRPASRAESAILVATPVPNPPPSISEHASPYWEPLLRLIIDAGVYTDGDYLAATGLVECYALWIRARKEVDELESIVTEGARVVVVAPQLTALDRIERRLMSWFATFGLSPVDRGRVVKQNAPTPENPWLVNSTDGSGGGDSVDQG